MIPGPVELALLGALVLLLFGSRILPWMSRRLGRSAERLRHVDDDLEDGRREVEQ